MKPLVSTAWLAERLDDPRLRILECTVVLGRGPGGRGYAAESGQPAWAAGHIPGSAFADLVHDLSDPDAPLLFTAPRASVSPPLWRTSVSATAHPAGIRTARCL